MYRWVVERQARPQALTAAFDSFAAGRLPFTVCSPSPGQAVTCAAYGPLPELRTAPTQTYERSSRA